MQRALVFGKGALYHQKEEYIKENFEIVGFLDNGDSAGVYNNIPVYNPVNVNDYYRDDVLIILMSYQYVAMWRQLYELGISSKKIRFGVMFPPLLGRDMDLFSDGKKLVVEERGVFYCAENDCSILVESHDQIREIAKEQLRKRYRNEYPIINTIAKMSLVPISRKFGMERGGAIDRNYIERFLNNNKELISGDCLEIAENTYTLKYGEDRITNSFIMHLKGWGVGNIIKGNLETGEGIQENQYDCVIITQTLMFIFDIKKAAENIYRMLKMGGKALITVSGISQISRYDADLWGSYYSFHEDAVRRLFTSFFGEENVRVETYGNVKTAVAMLCGLCQEDLTEDDF